MKEPPPATGTVRLRMQTIALDSVVGAITSGAVCAGITALVVLTGLVSSYAISQDFIIGALFGAVAGPAVGWRERRPLAAATRLAIWYPGALLLFLLPWTLIIINLNAAHGNLGTAKPLITVILAPVFFAAVGAASGAILALLLPRLHRQLLSQ
ncbi:MAG: hypothetical protein KGJ62_06025 [Armatimonadetes bacterium]|nr:hypothetical protein [Armatimonadota bacterium]MDE2205929.1 hypothetical protein [Armatimonadota bacterium]